MSNRLLALCVCLGVISAVVAEADGQTRRDVFEEANVHYQERRYDSAIVLYGRILEDGVESAPLYFNLANSYFRNGDLGRAILNYLRARRLDPRDDDINANLEFAKGFTRVQMEGVRLNPINSAMEAAVSGVSLQFLTWLSSMFFVGLFVLLALRYGLGWRNNWLRRTILLVLALVLTSASLTTFKYRHDYVTRWAVLTCDSCPVHIGPSEGLEVELQGAPGLVVEILDESGDWYNVLFENKRRGWIRRDLVAEV